MYNVRTIRALHMFANKVIPLVYDDSLSYYEILCKVKDKLNEVITNNNAIVEGLEGLDDAVSILRQDVDKLMSGDFDAILMEAITRLIKMVFFGLTDSGYFVAYIPESWDDITFNTTQYDIESDVEFGHLVLSY